VAYLKEHPDVAAVVERTLRERAGIKAKGMNDVIPGIESVPTGDEPEKKTRKVTKNGETRV
jgi:hypothetical protein